MKLAVTSQYPGGLESLVDPRFGRAALFTLVEIDGSSVKSVEVVDNPAGDTSGGTGLAAAQFLANMKVDAVITCNVGPKAFATLSALGIKVYTALPGTTVREAVEKYVSGKLMQASSPTDPAHTEMGRGGKRRRFRGGWE